MKKTVQSILFLFLILIAFLFYKTYFSSDNKIQTNLIDEKDQLEIEQENNLIKNLKYDVNFDNNRKYIITADLSELTYDQNVEVINMKKVIAIFIDENNIPLTITADEAIYNNSTYNTNFSNNIKIEYLNNIIISDKLDIKFSENIVSIYENVKYEGLKGIISADNVIIDLISKNIKINMYDKEKKIEVISN
tara:strand:- start:1601 stop:2176 length:576 start_codon:yes stop_codon:yes gene_type:complete